MTRSPDGLPLSKPIAPPRRPGALDLTWENLAHERGAFSICGSDREWRCACGFEAAAREENPSSLLSPRLTRAAARHLVECRLSGGEDAWTAAAHPKERPLQASSARRLVLRDFLRVIAATTLALLCAAAFALLNWTLSTWGAR